MCFILCSFYDTMYRPTKLVHRCQCCQQGVSFPDTQGAADLLGDHDPPEVIHSSDNASCFHISFSFSVGTPLLRCPRTPEDGCPYNYFTNYDAIICKQGRFILVQRKKASQLINANGPDATAKTDPIVAPNVDISPRDHEVNNDFV